MFVALAIVLWFVAAVVALARPKWGAALIWPAIWLYPNGPLYGTLPLNVRLDDLWVVFMFLLAISFSRGKGGGPLFWLAMAWAVSLILGDFAGFFITGGADWQTIVKAGLKTLHVPMIVYVLNVFIAEERDALNHLKAMAVAGAAASILGIAMVYFPEALKMFLIPSAKVVGFQVVTALEALEEHDVLTRRAQGSLGFMGQATMLMSVGLLCLWMMLYHANRGARLLFAVTLGISVVGLAYTITRNAIGGFMAGVVWGVVFTRRRMPLIGLLVLGALALVIQGQGGLLDRIMLRVTGPGGTQATPFMEGLLLRLDIWHRFAANFSPVYLFTGMGMTSVRMVAKSTAHNSYLGAFVYSGLTGAVVLYLILARAVRLGVNLRRYGQDGFSQGLGAWLCSLVVALCLAAFFIELFQQPLKMQVLFAAMVVADKQLARVRAAAEPRPSLVPEPGGGLLAYP
jgi:hypothetical protein